MISNEFIEKIIAEYTTIIDGDELGDFLDEENYYMVDKNATALLEQLEDDGFTEKDIKQLFDGEYLKNGGMWGMIPHEASIFTNEERTFYVMTIEVL